MGTKGPQDILQFFENKTLGVPKILSNSLKNG